MQQICCSIRGTNADYPFIPLRLKQIWETLKRATNISNHNFGNVFEEGHHLPGISSHQSCYQNFTMKSSLERINTPNTERPELVETN